MQPQQVSASFTRHSACRAPATGTSRDEFRLIGVAKHFDRDQEIFSQGDRADLVYKVVSGAVRSCRMLADGRRQICDFYLPGDAFGVDFEPSRRATAEALIDTVLIVARRSVVVEEPGQGEALWRHVLRDLQRSQDHVLTLGRRSATERLASFLLDLTERLGDLPELELPMSRQDIADYLGLTIETVSRTLTQLQVQGLIQLHGCRRIRLARRAALAELCE
jgi:CRP/FNR family nitrogen fixation transcriptional regulator